MYNHEVLSFIYRRWVSDSGWLDGNCYWFAYILCTRFPALQIWYEPVEGHFYAGNGKQFYDWTGGCPEVSGAVLFSDIKVNDPVCYARLLRDCVY